jgi:hypothetical protein
MIRLSVGISCKSGHDTIKKSAKDLRFARDLINFVYFSVSGGCDCIFLVQEYKLYGDYLTPFIYFKGEMYMVYTFEVLFKGILGNLDIQNKVWMVIIGKFNIIGKAGSR